MKKALHILAWVIGFLLVLFLSGMVAIQSPKVQTWLGQRVVARIKGSSDADIRFSQISIRPFDALVLRDFLIVDPDPRIEGMDTLVHAGHIAAKFSLAGLFKGSGIYVRRLEVRDASFNYGVEPDPEAPDGTSANYRRILGLPYPENRDEAPHWGKLLKAGDVEVKNFSFRFASIPGKETMAREGRAYEGEEIDWTDFTVDVHHLKARSLAIADDYITGDVQEGTFTERNTGFTVTSLRAKGIRVGNGAAIIEEAKITTEELSFHLSEASLIGRIDDYENFEEKIYIDARLLPDSQVSIRGLRYFSESLSDLTFNAFVQGRVSGYVNDLLLKDLCLDNAENRILARVDGRILGLPDIENSHLDLKLGEFSFPLGGLDDFVMGWSPETKLDLDSYAPGKTFNFSGNVKGFLNQLSVSGEAISDVGRLVAALNILNAVTPGLPVTIAGNIRTQNLDLGTLTGTSELGPLSLRAGLEAQFGADDTKVRIDSLDIDRLHALGYDYTGISAAGTYSEDAFDGRIISSDPNLSFIFQGLFNLSRKTRNAAYQFYASLGYADLHALHLDSREQSKVSFQASSNFIRTETRDLLGDVNLYGISLESETGRHQIGDISVRAHAGDNLHRIRVQSDYLQASFLGDHSIGDFVNDIKALILDRDLPALVTTRSRPWEGGFYEASFEVGAAQDLLTFLVPGLWVENRTEGSLSIDSDGLVTADVTSGRVALDDKFIKDLSFHFNNSDQVLQATLTGSSIALGSARLKGNRLSLFADDNHIGLGFTFDNEDEEDTKAELYLTGDLARDAEGLSVSARALPSNFYYRGNGWGLSSGDIVYKGGKLSIEKLQARHEDELLMVDGGFSPSLTDTLTVRMEKFDIGLVNTFTGGSPSLEGKATGRALVVSPGTPSPGLLASIVCDSTRISGHPAGRVQLASSWDEAEQRFNMYVRNSLRGKENLNISGYLVPSTKAVHAQAHLQKLDIGYAEGILEDLFSDFGGELSGKLLLDGKLDKLRLSSEDLNIEDGIMELDYLRVPYKMSGPLEVDEKGLYFKGVELSDGLKGKGKITGGLYFNHFSDMILDTHVNMNNMHVVSLQPGENDLLYGNVFGSARVDVTGPMSKMLLAVNAAITDDSTLHIPTSFGGKDSSQELLTFTEPESEVEEDAYEQMLAARNKSTSSSSNITVELKVKATPQLQVFLDMDENTLNANGNGTIELGTNLKDGGFSMTGDYTLTGGNFHFSVMNLVTRDFIIQDGSSIRFNGDIMNTDLDVKGLYVTKASLSTLLSEESASSRRTVNCGIDITGKLSNPEVEFSIDIPDLNPTTQTQVESVLNTADKVQKQFVYLLIAGNFLPGEDSGISANGSDVLFSNVSSIMSGQLNNIFQKLNIPLDLGLNYQSTQSGSNLFDVAVSTQLFNNRVLVNGTVGNKQLIGGTTTNEIAGDVDIEVKLNHSGSLRLTVFTHSADQFTYFLDNSQRHGAGIAYQREFNSFGQFFREFFMRYRRREQLAQEEALNQKNVVLQIDSTGHATQHYE